MLIDLGLPIEQYIAAMQTPIPAWHTTSYPKSVHFAVQQTGAIHQFVKESDTAWGLTTLHNPTWPGIVGADPNAQYLFIGVEKSDQCLVGSTQFDMLAKLICCIALQYHIPLTDYYVIAAYALDNRQIDIVTLPSGLLAASQSCFAAGGQPTIPDLRVLEDRVEALELCCSANSAAIAGLTTQISALSSGLSGITAIANSLVAWQASFNPQAMQAQINTLLGQVQVLMQQIANHQVCIDEVCPQANACLPVHYQLNPGNSMTITPNVPVWLNLPIMVAEAVPPKVLPGPLWSADLDAPGTYRIAAVVHLDPSEYCAGKLVWLDLVACGNIYRLDTRAMGAGIFPVDLSGSFMLVVPPACHDVHLQVTTDDTTTPNKVVTFADIQITCVYV